jgi:GNAT superfamily N-acetyltransferase
MRLPDRDIFVVVLFFFISVAANASWTSSTNLSIAGNQFSLKGSTNYAPCTHQLLYSTVWGTAKVKYQQRDIGDIIHPVPDDGLLEHYFAVSEKEPTQVAATYFLFPKNVRIGDQTVSAFYGTHFTVDPAHAGRGLGKAILRGAVEESRLHSPVPRLDYAYVETTNLGSWKAFKGLGYESLASYKVPTFSRTFTHHDSRVERLGSQDRATMINSLNTFYDDHVLTDFETSVIPHFYLVIRNRDGEIVAGAQCVPHHWYLERLAGFDGWLALHVLPRVPLLGRQIKRDMHFVRFGNLYVKNGHEADLASLMTHALNMYQVNTGTIYIDPRSRMYDILSSNRLGLVNSLAGQNPVEVMVHPDGIDDATKARIRQGPVHISIIDN